jgi:hypothetical protein
MNPGLYLLIKLIAYCVWCYIGLRLFRPEQTQFIACALRFGLIRLLMGLFFGVVIFFAAFTWANALGRGMSQDAITYLGAYVPVRWIEWTIMAILLNPSVRRAPHALVYRRRKARPPLEDWRHCYFLRGRYSVHCCPGRRGSDGAVSVLMKIAEFLPPFALCQ